MRSTREQVEAEAWESAYEHEANDEAGSAHVEGFIRGRTVTAEQVEAAAEELWKGSPFTEALEASWEEWAEQNPNAAELWKDDVRFTLTAAGLLIEGDN